MRTKITVSLNVPEEAVEAFKAVGWRYSSSGDSPVVSGVPVPAELIWEEGTPKIPANYSISCPDGEGYCKIDHIID